MPNASAAEEVNDAWGERGSARAMAEEFGKLLPALRRASVRAVRAREGLPALPEAQVVLLRSVAAAPLSPAEVAGRLHLARSTVSNLVRDLVNGGLLERRPSNVDGRSVLLDLTPRAREVLDTFRAGSGRALAHALGRLSTSEREKLHTALPALHLLLAELVTEAETAESDGLGGSDL